VRDVFHDLRRLLSALGGEGSGSSPTSTSAQLIDNVLQTGTKTGYNFTFSPGTADASGNVDYYAITANPITPGTTGLRYFYTDQTGVIRNSTTGTATSANSPIS
jgi:hypothetical protein